MSFASLAFAQSSQIPQAVLEQKTRKDLSALLAWSSAVSLPPPLVEFVAQYKIKKSTDISAVTLIAIQAAHDRRKDGNAYYFRNSETVVHPLGGGHHYTKTGVTVTIPNQKPKIYTSESGFPIENPRPYSGGVIALVCSTLYISNGRLEYVFQKKDWIKVFPITHAAFNPKGLPFVMHVLEKILLDNEEYRKMRTDGTGLKGPQLWDFLGNVINTCKHTDYIDLHDTIVKYFLQAIEFTTRRGKKAKTRGAVALGKYVTRTDDDQLETRIVTDATVGTWPLDLPPEWAGPVDKFFKVFGHRPFLLIGSIPQFHKWVASEDAEYNESEAYEAYNTRRSIGAGGSNGPGVALECNGFSSGASTTSNRCVLLLTMVLNVLQHDRDSVTPTMIDIRASVNDVAYLERSLPLVLRQHSKRIKYLVDRYVFENMSPQLKEMCVLNIRPDAHLIAWHDVDVESVVKNGSVIATMDAQWQQIISCFPAKKYTLMLPIISRRAFTKQPGSSIFVFRKPADFQGIISTYDEFFLASDIEDATNAQYQYLTKVSAFSKWLTLVARANSEYTTWFLAPKAMFSPLSNFIRGIAKGAPMKYREGSWEPVLYNDVKWSGELLSMPKAKTSATTTTTTSAEKEPEKQAKAQADPSIEKVSIIQKEEESETDDEEDEEPEGGDPDGGEGESSDDDDSPEGAALTRSQSIDNIKKSLEGLAGTVFQPEPSKTAPPTVPGSPRKTEVKEKLRLSGKAKKIKKDKDPPPVNDSADGVSYHDDGNWEENEPKKDDEPVAPKFAAAAWPAVGV